MQSATDFNGDYFHVVQAGETLSGIAAQYGLSVDTLAKLNGITNPDCIYPNQKLKLPESTTKQQKPSYYTVHSGDTLTGIAIANGTTVAHLQSLNSIKNPNNILAGHQLRIK